MNTDELKAQGAEIWKPVLGWEGRYEVSNLGRVKSLARYRVPRDRILSWISGPKGYLLVVLSGPHLRKSKPFYVHHLVLEAFVCKRPEGLQAAHGNGITSDCRLTNLRWATGKENSADKVKHNTLCRGETSGMSKLSESQVRTILKTHKSASELAGELGVCAQTIRLIRRRVIWKHVT